METYQIRESAFVHEVTVRGMNHDLAWFCLGTASRLRQIYNEPCQLADLENETLTNLRHRLHGLPCMLRYELDEHVKIYWEAVAGGLSDGDETVLYIIPPYGAPIPVPLHEDEAATSEQIAPAIAANTVEQVLLNWSRPQPEPKPPEPAPVPMSFIAGTFTDGENSAYPSRSNLISRMDELMSTMQDRMGSQLTELASETMDRHMRMMQARRAAVAGQHMRRLNASHGVSTPERVTPASILAPPLHPSALPTPERAQSSLDQLREKEAQAARRRARRGR